jgi:hypothetical protein
LLFGVAGPGAGCGVGFSAPSGTGSEICTTVSISTACTPASVATVSACFVGTLARM